MKIEILGNGCPNCKKLYAEAQKAVASSGIPADLEKVEKIEEIHKYGIVAMPGPVIDGEAKAGGRIPQSSEIIAWIQSASRSGE